MGIRLTIDRAGRVVIPKPLRRELRLEPGDALDMETAGEQITLRPVRGTGPLSKEQGVWVFRAGQPTMFIIRQASTCSFKPPNRRAAAERTAWLNFIPR
jgi:AbrB family looped-hinge helix DNA binding protein